MAEMKSPEQTERFAPGTYVCHEALHMLGVLAELVNNRLADHLAVASNAEWKALTERIIDALTRLCQTVEERHVAEAS